MEGGDTGGYSHGVLKSMTNNECHSSFGFVFVPGWSLLSVGTSFLYAGSCFCMQAVIFICGQLLCGGGGGGLPWLVLVFCCHITVSDVAPGLPVSKESGGRGVFTHLLVVIAASDMGPQCRWQGGGVGCLSPLVPFVGGVLSWSHHRLLAWCHPAIVVAWSSSVVVMVVVSHHCCRLAADMAFLHRSDGVLACPGGCWWWVVVWQQ